MSLSSEQESAARAIVAQLRLDVYAARLNAATTWGDATAGMGAALDAVSEHLYRAETVWLDRVRNGEKDFAWWLAAIENEASAVRQYSDTASSDGIIARAWSTVTQSARDVATLAKDAVPVIGSASKWLVVALVAVAALYAISFIKSVRP